MPEVTREQFEEASNTLCHAACFNVGDDDQERYAKHASTIRAYVALVEAERDMYLDMIRRMREGGKYGGK